MCVHSVTCVFNSVHRVVWWVLCCVCVWCVFNSVHIVCTAQGCVVGFMLCVYVVCTGLCGGSCLNWSPDLVTARSGSHGRSKQQSLPNWQIFISTKDIYIHQRYLYPSKIFICIKVAIPSKLADIYIQSRYEYPKQQCLPN